MNRKFLAAAAVAPLLAASAPALAQVTISSSTSTPVATATASSGAPSDVTVAAGGSIEITAAGTALTLNSNNSVTNAGSLGATGVDNVIGLDIVSGFTGTVTNTGSIVVNESYTPPTDPNNNGLVTGAFAQGSGRVGFEVTGSSIFQGSILDTGSITVDGNNSQAISIQAPISGDLLMLQVTPATSSVAASILNGSINVTGQNAIGLQVTPTGGIGGNLRITSVSATGPGAQGVVVDGPVGGGINISATVVATGYRATVRQTNPLISATYTQEEMQQGGAAVTIGGSVGQGLILSAPPPVLDTTNPTINGVPEGLQGTGAVFSYGSAPAMQIGGVAATAGGTAPNITLGSVTGSPYVTAYNSNPPTQNFGLVIQGSVSGQSLFDQLTSPFLLTPVSATALQIGGNILITPVTYTFDSNFAVTATTPAVYLPSGSVNIAGGIYNSGSITASTYQADATAIHIGAGGTVPSIYNDGQILAQSVEINSATGVTVNGGIYPDTPAPVPVNITAIQIDPGASITTITNNGGILAELSGTAGVGGSVTAIIDKSGTLQNINNTGSITAELNQTVTSAPMPGTTVAIDMRQSSLPQSINQTFSPLAASTTAYVATSAYTLGQVVSYLGNIYVNVAAAGAGFDPVDDPTYWREIGATTPTIIGDIYFGAGPDTLNVQAGAVFSTNIAMGGALNTITVNGTSSTNTATVIGNITEQAGGQFAINVNNGILSDTNPNRVNAVSVNIGATGALLIAADPLHGTNGDFVTSGASTIASGAQFGLTLVSLQSSLVQTYTILQAAPGSLSVGTLGATLVGNTPFLYSATAGYVPLDASTGDSEVQLTVTRKTAAQLGFNAAEASAFNAVLAAVPNNLPIQQALLAQTTEASFRSVYDQLLPNQGQGIFQALDAAAEKISGFTGVSPDNATHTGGSSLWLQEVNERVDRTGIDTVGSDAKLLGLVGGYERMGAGGGAVGLTLAYYNAQEDSDVEAIGSRDVASLVEAGLYYRRSVGGLTVSARGAGGYGWFSENRLFASGTAFDEAHASWTGIYIDGHLGASYEMKLFGPYYARPEVSVDYLRLHQNGYAESGPDAGFNLAVAPQNDTQFTGQAVMILGRQWGRAAWFRSEVRFGYREVISGNVGEVTANFAGGSPFTLLGDPDHGGWMTVGFSLKSGSQFSYLALEGDADFRSGEQRYDLRVAGRSVF